MANWKKVVVSGSSAEFSTLKVDNLASGVVTGSGSTLGTQAINGTGNILATTGATGISASGSFSGSFHGDGTNLTGVVASAPNSLSGGAGLTAFSYNGSTAVTASVSGAASLSINNITKWTGDAFANSSLTDNGTAITGNTSIQLTGASSNLSGSFSGSFQGDGSGLTGIAATLFVSGGTGNGTVDLKTQTLSIVGTANEIETSASGQTVTIGLPNNVTVASTLTAATASINNDLTVQGNTLLQGDLTVNGTTTYINTQNLYVEDKFALFASGSTTATDGGFIIQSAAAGIGYAFGYDASADRWALEDNLSGSATAFSGTPTAYVASVEFGLATNKPADPSYGGSANGYGNIWVSTDTSDIWIYA